MAKLKDNSEQQYLTKILNKGISNPADPSLSDTTTKILENYIEFHNDIPNEYKLDFINQARKNCKKKGYTFKNFLAELKSKEKKYLSKKRKKYFLFTDIALPKNVNNIFRFENCTININPSKTSNDKFTKEREKAFIIAKNYVKGQVTASKYSQVKISINARCPYEAFQIGMNNLNYIRGMLNFHFNFGPKLSLGKRKEPINKILLGPVHSIHSSNYELVKDQNGNEYIWYEFISIEKNPIIITSKELARIVNLYKNLMAKTKEPFDYKDVFIMYCSALDTSILHDSYLKLWIVLEQLLKTDESKKIYDRISPLYKQNKNFIRLKLKTLREHRNKLSHKELASDDFDPNYIHMLNNIVSKVFLFHLRIGKRFKSMGNASEYLDFLYKYNSLKEEKNKLELAEEILGS